MEKTETINIINNRNAHVMNNIDWNKDIKHIIDNIISGYIVRHAFDRNEIGYIQKRLKKTIDGLDS